MSADGSGDLKFNFGIPVGQRGEKGDVGDGVNYLGEIDATTAPAPSDPVNGDFYVNTVEGTSSWPGLGAVHVNSRLIYNSNTGQWDQYDPLDNVWREVGGEVYPVNAAADVKIGGTLPSAPNIRLLADGQAFFENTVSGPKFSSRNAASTNKLWSGGLSGVGTETSYIRADGSATFKGQSVEQEANAGYIWNEPGALAFASMYAKGFFESSVESGSQYQYIGKSGNVQNYIIENDGTVKIGGTLPDAPNISLNANGEVVADCSGTANAVQRFTANSTSAGGAFVIKNISNATNDRNLVQRNATDITAAFKTDGSLHIGGSLNTPSSAAPNITLNADGSADLCWPCHNNYAVIGTVFSNVLAQLLIVMLFWLLVSVR